MFGSYDITMCNSESCPRKDTCHRYLQLKRLGGGKAMEYMVSVFLIDDPLQCHYYWEEGKWNTGV